MCQFHNCSAKKSPEIIRENPRIFPLKNPGNVVLPAVHAWLVLLDADVLLDRVGRLAAGHQRGLGR